MTQEKHIIEETLSIADSVSRIHPDKIAVVQDIRNALLMWLEASREGGLPEEGEEIVVGCRDRLLAMV